MRLVWTWLFAASFATLFSSHAHANIDVFINEIDYDNEGLDRYEWIEIAGSAGATLDDYEVLLIDQLGNVYNTLDLAAAQFTFLDETETGWGFFVLGSVSPEVGDGADYTPNPWDRDQIQNGPRDSVQLRLKSGAVNVHLIDYEGDNPSTAEDEVTNLPDSNDDLNRTIYKTGEGSSAGEFPFANDPGNATPGEVNIGQVLHPIVSAVVVESVGTPQPLTPTPNPFRDATTVSFQLMRTSAVGMTLFDPTGRRVRDWPREMLGPGQYRRSWDARDNLGRSLAPGLYFFQLSVNGEIAARGRGVLIR